MAYRFPPPPLHNPQEGNAENSCIVAQIPILPLQVFSVPPPPIPPPLPLLLPPATLQQYNIPNQTYSRPGDHLPVQTSDFKISTDPFIGIGRCQTSSPLSSLQLNTSDNETLLQEASDELWLKDYLSRKRRPVLSKRSPHDAIQIFQAKECLKEMITKFKKLKSVQVQLKTELNTMDSESWESALKDIQFKKNEFEASLHEFENPGMIEYLKKSLRTRARKRKSEKRRRRLRQELRSECFDKRQQLHRSIDGWLKDMQGALEKAKIEDSLKEEADAILSDVTRKKAEARRQLALLLALVKLHELRVKTATSKGQLISAEHGIRFSKVTVHLQKLWEKQLKEYNLEEHGLRVMLNEAVDERDHTRVLREKRNLKQWEQLLFGEKRNDVLDFYTTAENSLEAFINIRHDWDKFITSSSAPMSSAIPIGWILPTAPSSVQWETVLSTIQSVE